MRAFYKPSLSRLLAWSVSLLPYLFIRVCILSPPTFTILHEESRVWGWNYWDHASLAKQGVRRRDRERIKDLELPISNAPRSLSFLRPRLHSFAWPSHTLFFCGLARAFARLSSNTDKIGTKKVERTETTYREMVQNASACRVKGFLHRSKCGTRVGHAFDA